MERPSVNDNLEFLDTVLDPFSTFRPANNINKVLKVPLEAIVALNPEFSCDTFITGWIILNLPIKESHSLPT